MKRKMTKSILICPNCGMEMPIPRQASRQRSDGHKKNMYCWFCSKRPAMIEVKSGQAYMKANGSFVYV